MENQDSTWTCFQKYLEEDGLELPTVPAAAVGDVSGIEDLVGRDAGEGHSLVPLEHPDDDVREAVLGLENINP